VQIYLIVELFITIVESSLVLRQPDEKVFYEAFSEDEAKKILKKIEFHYTPKYASWLNAAEIEIGVMDEDCTDRRIGDIGMLTNEVAAWTKRRNESKKKIKLRATTPT
jgi:CRISPR/Cas system CSM-associated protein Csm4 (group 5 of RAMP superfamily)